VDVARRTRELGHARIPVRVVGRKHALRDDAEVREIGRQLEFGEGAAHVARGPRVVQDATPVRLVADEEARVRRLQRKHALEKLLADCGAPRIHPAVRVDEQGLHRGSLRQLALKAGDVVLDVVGAIVVAGG